VSEIDETLAKASALLDRTRAQRTSLRARSGVSVGARLTRIAIADAAILVAAIVIGWIVPLGIGGAMLVMGALIAATLLLAIFPTVPVVTVEKLPETPLKLLPLRTEQWLETQRSALPAPAQSLIDGIGNRLETLAPQLATLNENEPVTVEIRKLVSEQLPELVNGYTRVPQPLRGVARNGRTPDQQLADGLKVIADEIAEMTARLAEGDLDQLQTRGRYLEMKYRDDAIEG
jgi:hypothetical protein